MNFLKRKKPIACLLGYFFLFNAYPHLSAQITATVTGGACAGSFTINLNGTENGKNKYSGTATFSSVNVPVDLAWSVSNSRWEIVGSLPFGVVFYNTTATTPDPPCYNNGVWTALGVCTGGVMSASSGTCAAIPIELRSFTAQNKGKSVLLNWQTANEIQNKGFEIERSTNGASWQALDFVAAKGQNSTYIFEDKRPLSIGYYRLKQIDHDGFFEYSKTVVANWASAKSKILVSPNPNATGIFQIQGLPEATTDISLINTLGQVIWRERADSPSAIIHLKDKPSAGLYHLRFKTGDSIQTQMVRIAE
jgi:hypothetical protein